MKKSAPEGMFYPMFRPITGAITRAMGGGGGDGAPFDPLTIPALTAWIDPGDASTKFQDAAGTTPVTATGQPVGRVEDKSGNGNHFTQPTDAIRPTDSTFGDLTPDVPALAFVGVSTILRCDALAALFNGTGPQWTAHVVYNTQAKTARAVFGAGNSASTATYTWLQGMSVGGKFTLETRRGGASGTSAIGGDVGLTTQVISIRHNGSTADMWRNGVKVATGEPVALQTISNFDTFAIGALVRTTVSSYHDGKIGEFLISSEANSDADVMRVQSYLMSKLASTQTPVDLFIVTGQSNAEGRGTGGPSVPAGDAFYVGAVSLSPLADPVGGASVGSAWPSFANEWKSSTGKSSAWVEQATGGSGLIAGVGASDWSPSGTLRLAAVTAANSAVHLIQTSLQYTLGATYLCWQQGEQDATVYDGTTVSAATYQPAQEELFAYFFSNVTGLDAILVSELGEHVTPNANYALIRAAQNTAVAATPNCHLAFIGAKNFPAEGKMKADGVHYNQAGLDEMGAAMGAFAATLVA